MKIFLLSVPYDSGHHKKRLGIGPTILVPVLEKQLKENGHTTRTGEVHIENDPFPTEVTTSFKVNRKVAEEVRGARAKGELPVIFSGNCNTAIGTLAGSQNNSGVIWFDCHGDFNTPETTIGGFLDGMSLSMVAGHCWRQLTDSVAGFKPVSEERIILIGARDFDNLEEKNFSPSAIRLITPEILKANAKDLSGHLTPMESIYLHIDLDVIDPNYVRVNEYSTEGGLTPDELCEAIAFIKKQYSISAVAFTAYDPSYDPEKKVPGIVKQVLEIITA
jgi:arginase